MTVSLIRSSCETAALLLVRRLYLVIPIVKLKVIVIVVFVAMCLCVVWGRETSGSHMWRARAPDMQQKRKLAAVPPLATAVQDSRPGNSDNQRVN